jgi:ABC-type transport system involved in multi-copper enzyme maturation permease subunit
MRNVLTITHLTIHEARRKRIVLAALLCGAAFIAVFATGMYYANREMERASRNFMARQANVVILTIAGLFACNFLTALFAVLLPVDALSGEVDSGVMQTIASKPIRRADIVVGKWLGHGLIVAAYLGLLGAGVLLTAKVIAGYTQYQAGRALALMLLEAVLLVTISIAGGTRLSTVTNGITALGFYGVAFIGGWVEQIGSLAGLRSARTVGVVVSLISPPDALWRLATYELQPPLVRDIGAAVFQTASVPTALMVWWAAGFTLVTLAWAVQSFARRAL